MREKQRLYWLFNKLKVKLYELTCLHLSKGEEKIYGLFQGRSQELSMRCSKVRRGGLGQF